MCCSTYLYIHWLILVCALTRYQTHNGVWGQHSNQLSYSAKAHLGVLRVNSPLASKDLINILIYAFLVFF